MNIACAIQWGDGWYELDGELLYDIAPHLAGVATFVVHRDPQYGAWQVCNVETGLNILRGSKLACISQARENLSRTTVRDIARAYRHALRDHTQLRVELSGR